MASYTDNIPQFRPYIQQLPVEAMVNVGTTLQRRYDEGYQRIQSQIDKIAGLSIMRDVDKQYLQSKMNDLTAKLRMVSMGDFSNYQLVNSVGGMVNQVGKDKYIQSAVTSTARVQKELSNMEKLRSEGKSDKNNEAYFYEKVLNPYLSGGLNDERGNPVSFNGTFSPYVNITEEIRKLVKDAGLDEKLIQQMYETDFQGNIKPGPDGKAMSARTMTEIKESSNARQVEAIVNSVLTRGDVQNQMNIDAWANTRGTDPAKLLESYKSEFNSKFESIDDRKVVLFALLKGNVTDTQKADIEANIKKLDQQKDIYKAQLAKLVSLEQTDPQAFKESLYKMNYENSLKGIFIETKREEKNLDSPLTKQLNFEQEYELKYGSEIFDRNIALREQNRKDKEFALEVQKYNDSLKKPGDPSSYPLVSADNIGIYNKTATQKNEERIATLSGSAYEVGFDLMYDLFKRSGFPTTERKDLFEKYIQSAAAKEGFKDKGEYVYAWIKDLDINAKVRGVKLDPRDRQMASRYLSTYTNYLDVIATTKAVDMDIEKETGYNPEVYLSQLIPTTVTLQDGQKIGFSKRDMMDYITYDIDPSVKKRVDALYGNKGGLLGKIENIIAEKYNFPKPTTAAGGESYSLRIRSTPEWKSMQVVSETALPKIKEAVDMKEAKLKEIYADTEARTIPIGETDAEIKAAKQRVLEFMGWNTNLYGNNFDREAILNALNKTETKISFMGNAASTEGEGWTGGIMVNDGGIARHIYVEKQSDLEFLTGQKFQEYRVNAYLNRAIAGNTHSTNLGTTTDNPQAYKTARFDDDIFITLNSQLSGESRYVPIGADLNLMYDEKTWNPVIYVKDKSTNEIFNVSAFDFRMNQPKTYLVGQEQIFIRDLALLDKASFEMEIKKTKGIQ